MKNEFFKKLFQYIACFLISSIISFILFILLFHTVLFANMHVLMYRGIVFLLICGIINLLISHLLTRVLLKELNGFDTFSIMVMFVSISFAFFILVPVTVERSVSVYMLSNMYETDKAYSKSEIEENFINIYVKKFGAFDKRFEEQIVTGTIDKIIENDVNIESNDTSIGTVRYKINDRGKFIVKTFRFIANLFNTDKKLVYP